MVTRVMDVVVVAIGVAWLGRCLKVR